MHPLGVLELTSRIVAGITIGLIIIGIIVFAPIAALLLGLITLSSATLPEAIVILVGVITLTLGFWGGIWWSEKHGWARLLVGQGGPDERDFEEREMENEDPGPEI